MRNGLVMAPAMIRYARLFERLKELCPNVDIGEARNFVEDRASHCTLSTHQVLEIMIEEAQRAGCRGIYFV